RISPWATRSQLRSEAGQGRARSGHMGEAAVEQQVVQAARGDVGVGGDLVDHHAAAAVVVSCAVPQLAEQGAEVLGAGVPQPRVQRSEEHTSELQSRFDLVCRLLLEKKNT